MNNDKIEYFKKKRVRIIEFVNDFCKTLKDKLLVMILLFH